MRRIEVTLRALALFMAVGAVAAPAAAQGDREGLSREQMWRAPTAEDWQRPVLIKWERTWNDAVAVSKETGKPILVCINMDGEIASEHYAGVRYRQAEIAPLYEPYVCVIASVYRHNPRDFDDEGRRIPCPRFGDVTCAEHIWIEPIIYEKFCDGQRVAPRHICVDLEGKELYDVYYVNDTAGVFDAIRDRRKELPAGRNIVRGDRPVLERVASRAVEDRRAVEKAYREGDAEMRQALLEAAVKNNSAEQVDLLRLAIFGLDTDLARTARQALALAQTPDATELVSDALQVPMDQAERDALLATLKRLGAGSVRAQWLAGVHQGLGGASASVDVKAWSRQRGSGPAPARAFGGGALAASYVEKQARAAYERPKDPMPRVEFAEASLALALAVPRTYAMNLRLGRIVARQLYADAARAAAQAEALGAKGWRVNAVRALAAYYGDKREEGYKFADAAMKDLPPGDEGWASMAIVTIFAESRWMAIRAAVREQKRWPPSYLSDLHSAYTVLMRHPLGTDGQVVWHYELLDWLGARFRANQVLREGLERFPESAKLHERFRDRLLKWRGGDGLEAAYAKLLEQEDSARILWFAGEASNAAARLHRRLKRYKKALKAYERAIAHYEGAMHADEGQRVPAELAIALAWAGRARVAYELGNDRAALQDMLACLARDPEAAGTRDDLGITPGETAQMLLARLREKKQDGDAKQLEAALAKIDPELLRPDIGLTGR
ncbi:MAG: hypothetical protein O7C98_03625 [Planctomycetota bacterium]|nr:hypothetical protein [Planctomycetota bacterium]